MQDVRKDRNLYIGGSDIPVIMGISPFKKRFDLLLEKAGLQENDFEGNQYTEYGNVLEPKIRDYINREPFSNFEEDKRIVGDIRCHVDGFSVLSNTILEIKTTSQIYNSVNDYKVYLVQLLFYMSIFNATKGKLAVYERPSDFNEEFEENRLTIYDIDILDYKDLVNEIMNAVNQFRSDLEKVKANPFITEEELQPKEIIELSSQVVALENQLATLKEIEKKSKEVKAKLFDLMQNNNIKKWTTNNGVQITLVESKPSTTETIKEFNVNKFHEENSELYENYCEEKTITKKGSSGYVKITLPKVS